MIETRLRYKLVNPQRHFDDGVDQITQEALYKIVEHGYEASHGEAITQFEPELARSYCGQRRVALIESALLGLPKRFPGTQAELVPNSVRSHHHVEFRSRDVVIAASKTQGPLTLPRTALFRHHLYASNTHGLFDEPEQGDDPLFCLLLHGVYGSSLAAKPDFVTVVYPLPGGTGIAGAIDLKARFGQDATPQGSSGEREEKMVGGLRKDAKKKVS